MQPEIVISKLQWFWSWLLYFQNTCLIHLVMQGISAIVMQGSTSYRPLGKVMFSEASVILFTGGRPTWGVVWLGGLHGTPPPPVVTCSGGHCTGWYASYWNALLLCSGFPCWHSSCICHTDLCFYIQRDVISVTWHWIINRYVTIAWLSISVAAMYYPRHRNDVA